MLPTKRNVEDAPTREVFGEFPVHYHYTAGIAGEKFFLGLKEQKLLVNTCASCNKTYLPPKIYCEDCFDELDENSYSELEPRGKLFSFTKVYYDHRGDELQEPYFLGLVKVEGADTTFYHKLVDIIEPNIGMEVKVKWRENRTGSLFDIVGFESS